LENDLLQKKAYVKLKEGDTIADLLIAEIIELYSKAYGN
jgi:hypothetical protein